MLVGLASAAILALHGANYLAMKTEGELYARVVAVAKHDKVAGGWQCGAGQAWNHVHPAQFSDQLSGPSRGVFVANRWRDGACVTLVFRRRQRDVAAFMASSLFIAAMLGSVAWGCYPNILIATNDPAHSLTVFNAATDEYGLRVGLLWFLIGFVLVIAYQVYAHRCFWGKVPMH